MSQKQPEQNPQPVQKIWLQYAKRSVSRFASHRDFSRVFQRALRRAGVPMAYSSGFHPHPRISFAQAVPTGAASEAEYLQISLSQTVDPEKLVEALNDSLPRDFRVLKAVEAGGGKLQDRIEASKWDCKIPVETDRAALENAVREFLSRDEVLVTRKAKKGERTFDTRKAVMKLEVTSLGLQIMLRHVVPLVRPDDVIRALILIDKDLFELPDVLFDRLCQGPLEKDDKIGDPLASVVA